MDYKEVVWSHSSWKNFEQCPRKYNFVNRLKKVPRTQHPSAAYGIAVHKAFEDHIKHGIEFPAEFKKFAKWAKFFLTQPGEKYAEQKFGLTHDGKACEFFDKNVWWRGVADAIAVPTSAVARVVDWKTNKSEEYADPDQLELLAEAIFAKYPHVQTVKGMLAFLVPDKPIVRTYHRKDFAVILSKWQGRIDRIAGCQDADVWNPKQGPLCGYCDVPHSLCEFRR